MSLLDLKQAAAELNVTPYWLAQAVREDRVTHVRLGRQIRFDRADLDELIAKSRVVAHDPYARTPRQLAAMRRKPRAA